VAKKGAWQGVTLCQHSATCLLALSYPFTVIHDIDLDRIQSALLERECTDVCCYAMSRLLQGHCCLQVCLGQEPVTVSDIAVLLGRKQETQDAQAAYAPHATLKVTRLPCS